MAGIIVSAISIDLPYILVAVKSSFLKFDMSNIYKTIFTSSANEIPPLQRRFFFCRVGLSVWQSVCLFVDNIIQKL